MSIISAIIEVNEDEDEGEEDGEDIIYKLKVSLSLPNFYTGIYYS